MNCDRRGHILPLTLAVLAVAAATLGQICRNGMSRALDVGRQEQELRRRWALQSCQTTLLPRAAGLLTQAEHSAGRPLAVLETDLALGGTVYHLTLADEQAKANLNLLYRRDRAQAEQAARAASHAAGGPATHLRPLPARSGAHADALAIVFDSPGQFFTDTGDFASLRTGVRGLTCWGDGKLNWRRASPAALSAVLASQRGLVEQILRQKSAGKEGSLSAAFEALQIPAEHRQELEKMLTDGSGAQSVWIACDNPGRAALLAVRINLDNGRTRLVSFSW